MRIYIFLLCLFVIQNVFSQSAEDEKFLTVGAQNITTAEFERIFNKNNSITTADKQNVEEYLQMFINYKLKVQAAMDAGLDTTSSFKAELKGYRDQLAKSYLTDNAAVDSLIKEAYTRMHTEVNASHIMTALKENPSPADTLDAWNKIMNIRQRLLNGESFGKLASELSEDPSARTNSGNLGYFTAFQMVYPFETAAYNNNIGEISPPVRTRFGYHLIKTHDKRPASGQVRVAHIMVMVPQGSGDSVSIRAEQKIRTIAGLLKSGLPFDSLAKQVSEDRGSARNGGELPVFGPGQMIPEFETAAFSLQYPGEISGPVRTFYGWHIIKLLEKKGIPAFEEVKPELKSRISRDERADYGTNSLVAGLKKEYSFQENTSLLSVLFETGMGNPDIPADSQKELFRLSDQSYKLSEFLGYLENLPASGNLKSSPTYIRNAYLEFVKNRILEYEDNQLENKYPDFKSLVQEYHDGILLFNLSDSIVWSKAMRDTAGLENFFRANRKEYMWPERLDATIINCNSPEIAQKAIMAAKKLKTPEKLEKELAGSVCDTSANCLTLSHKLYSKGDDPLIDSLQRRKGISSVVAKNAAYRFVVVHNLQKPSPKSLDETRGQVISDYQNILEKEWINRLREQYPVTVNKDILNQLKIKYDGKI